MKNNISFIPETFMSQLLKNETMKQLNLARNRLTRVPKLMQNLIHFEKIWLSGNPFHCDCDMTWMIGCLNNLTTPSKQNIIVDYQEVKCYSGMMIGKLIYKLNVVEMGCFPPQLTLRQKLAIGIASAVAVVIIAMLIYLVIKRSTDIKFFLYYYCKWYVCFGITKDDKNEKLDSMEYDAYISYR